MREKERKVALRNLRSRKNQEPSGFVPRLPFRLYLQSSHTSEGTYAQPMHFNTCARMCTTKGVNVGM